MLVIVVIALSRSSFSVKSICLVRLQPLQKNRRTDLFGKCWRLSGGFGRRIVLLNSSCAHFPQFLTISEERSRVRDQLVCPMWALGCQLSQKLCQDGNSGSSSGCFAWAQIRFSLRSLVYNHNKTNKCCRKVKLRVNSSGNKFSILHILQMESSRPDGNKASLLLIFISVRAFVF